MTNWQCSDMFKMTRECKATITLGAAVDGAITDDTVAAANPVLCVISVSDVSILLFLFIFY
jgi:hypothetical protein